MNKISEMIENWPEVDLHEVEVETLRDLAGRWLAEQHAIRVRAKNRKVVHFNRNPQAARVERDAAVDNAVASIIQKSKGNYVENFSKSVLNLTFRVDGMDVKFGDMTLDQHRRARTTLERKSAGLIESAALHAKAEDLLMEWEANTLYELEKDTVVA